MFNIGYRLRGEDQILRAVEDVLRAVAQGGCQILALSSPLTLPLFSPESSRKIPLLLPGVQDLHLMRKWFFTSQPFTPMRYQAWAPSHHEDHISHRPGKAHVQKACSISPSAFIPIPFSSYRKSSISFANST